MGESILRGAIYARYSSENQRPESIDDQISSCKKLAALRSYTLSDAHIYMDEATSGARKDRPGGCWIWNLRSSSSRESGGQIMQKRSYGL